MKKIFLMAMDEGAKLEQVLEAAKFISERLDGKPTQEIDETGGGHGPLIINIGSRNFAITVFWMSGDVVRRMSANPPGTIRQVITASIKRFSVFPLP